MRAEKKGQPWRGACLLWILWIVVGFMVSQPCASVSQRLRRFGDLRKNTPLEFWSMHLVDFVIFNDFRAPPQALCGCVAAACGTWATPNKNTPLDFWRKPLR